jgi:hypothetical protein
MSKSEFLSNLKTARNLFFHRVQTDHPGVDAKSIDGQLARAAIWLTPSTVKGFDAKDFPELSESARNDLKEKVSRFESIAKQVPATEPATAQQIQQAMPCFIGILSALELYLRSGGELQQVRDALEAVTFPEAVLTWDFELGTDSTGDPAVWVWVFVDSATAESDDFASLASDIEDRIRESLSAANVTRWPYVRFRTASEQRALSD